mgnify:CR=1 FL=1
MDCEKFEAAMIDELYGELDELTSAAAKRHVAGCARCASRIGGLRATRRVATVPLVDPPAGLEERILEAAREAATIVPLRSRVARAVSFAGSWAMRPQTAMAAVFLVMIGTSVLLLRGKAREVAHAPVTVTEQGSPAPPFEPVARQPADSVVAPTLVASAQNQPRPAEAKGGPAPLPLATDTPTDDTRASRAFAKAPARMKADEETLAQNALAPSPPAPAAPPPMAAGAAAAGGAGNASGSYLPRGGASPFDAALAQYRAGRFDEAARAFDGLAPGDANAELWAARSVREGKGCRAAVGRFDQLAQRAQGTPSAWDALLEGALCYRALASYSEARARLNALMRVDSRRERARAELERLDQLQQGPPSAAPPPAAKVAAPNSAPASPPAATSEFK